MLYTLFYFIRDGEKFLGKAVRVFSLGQEREKVLYERFVADGRATLKVTLIIGGIQGTLGGLIFWLTGIEGPLMWGIVMIFTAIVPVVGCSIIWVPAGVIMMITGHFLKGVIILTFGVLVISMVDHFLRPILIGRDVQMHPLMVFLSTLGGLSLFGFSGFIIGPDHRFPAPRYLGDVRRILPGCIVKRLGRNFSGTSRPHPILHREKTTRRCE